MSPPSPAGDTPVLQVQEATLSHGSRTLWESLTLDVQPGEFLAVLGANGAGKTSLLRAVLGLQRLSSGSIRVAGEPARRGSRRIGYVPQQRRIDPQVPMRARDVVRQGIDGHAWGFARWGRVDWPAVEAALAQVDASSYTDMPVGVLSGGEQQRVRIAQALVSDPSLLLCDEPLVSLDLRSQRVVTGLVDRRRREHGTAVLFVTHEINPVLPYVDKVLYLAAGRFRLGSVEDVLSSDSLSELFDAPIEVIHSHGRILVAGIPETPEHPHEHERPSR